jgi:pyruvate dehydrogenase (quinone)
LPVTVVVFNNSALGMVELEMLVEGLPAYGTSLGKINYADIAAAADLDSLRITDPHELRLGLERALSSSQATIVDVVTDPNALSLPPHITIEQIRGFATGLGKTVLTGGVGRMLDLARSNLRNIRAL